MRVTVFITKPRGFKGRGMGNAPRIVVQIAPEGIRFRRCLRWTLAQEIADAWDRGDYSKWPGEIRAMPIEEEETELA